MSRLGFRVDFAGCTGCKACQVACQDKHGLRPDVRWRRVVEVTGGGWTRREGAWLHDTRTWYVSVACMHCERPICVEVCPTKALAKRADGVVAIEEQRCMGCRYCEWACPYRAPAFDAVRGVMTKCDLCRDHLEQGRAPACVEACPVRVLTLADLDEGEASATAPFPLPPPHLTEPVVRLGPHRDAARGDADGVRIGNEEEIG